MAEEQHTSYSFGRRSGGIFMGLDGAGLILGGVLAGLAMLVGFLVNVVVGGVVLFLFAAFLWSPGPGGQPLRSWLGHIVRYLARLGRGAEVPPTYPATGSASAPPLPAGVQAIEPDGLVRHDASEYSGVWRLTRSADAALTGLDALDDAHGSWGNVLDQLQPPAVKALQWVVTTTPDPASEPMRWLEAHQGEDADEAAVDDYMALVSQLGGAARRREAYLVVRVAPPKPTVAAARRELRIVQDRLAALPIGRVDGATLHRLIATASMPLATLCATAPLHAVPGSREDPSGHVTTGGWHRTLVATELPRTPTPGDWLWPLLSATPPQRTWRIAVTVHGTPLTSWRAMRAAETAVTSAESELRRRQKAGFNPRSRDILALQGQANRENEVAAGRSTWKLQLSVTVSALSRSALDDGCTAVMAAMRAAHLEVAVATGQQAAGWRASLPLGLPGVGPLVTATSRNARSVAPLGVSLGVGGAGVALGLDVLSGGAWCFDPWATAASTNTNNPNIAVFGQVGRGKSALSKLLLLREVGVFGRRAWVLDPKGEYGPLGEALGLPVIRLQPGGTVRVNPLDVPAELDAEAAAAARAELLLALGGSVLGRRPIIEESRAVEEVCLLLPPGEPVLADVVEGLLHPTAEVAAALATTPEALADAVRKMALALQSLLTGVLRGMFSGRSTVRLSPNGGIIDLSATYGHDDALAPLLAASIAWLTAALANGDRRPTLIVVDEAWKVMATGVDFLRSSAKLARQLSLSLVLLMHHLGDLASAGDAGSATSRRAEGLFADVGTVILFGEHLASDSPAIPALGLTEREVEEVARLQRNRALVVSGGQHRMVDTVQTAREARITYTDQAVQAAAG